MSDLAETNRKHFDKVATTHQNDFGDLINAAIREFQARRGWITPKLNETSLSKTERPQVKLLDYACGAGTVSKALAPYATQAIGLDLSSGMVAEYNRAASEMGFNAEKMHAYRYNLLAGDAETDTETANPLPEGTLTPSSFDVVVIGMALHHVSEPGVLLARFKELLKPRGVCVVMDMVPTDDAPDIEGVLEPSQLEVVKTIGKRGFTEQEMRTLYEGAGMRRGFEYVVIEDKFLFTMFGHKFQVTGFMARGEVE
ncbi:S-adenosyl-L-methionine-dependent methyltransferase [Aspergillus pseudoustus]|uniref:S-adenosyl-L-methionine-dependent methyltransferase n=1 Tax=Aspergillus pseudoustus TaxID=1810923 RepID=A0ABR4L524_9EURO